MTEVANSFSSSQKGAAIHIRALFRSLMECDFNEKNTGIVRRLYETIPSVVFYENSIGGVPTLPPKIAANIDPVVKTLMETCLYIPPFGSYPEAANGYLKLADTIGVQPQNMLIFTNDDFDNKRKAIRNGFSFCHAKIRIPKGLLLDKEEIENLSDRRTLEIDRIRYGNIQETVEDFIAAPLHQEKERETSGIVVLDVNDFFGECREQDFNDVNMPWINDLKQQRRIVLIQSECDYSGSKLKVADDMIGMADATAYVQNVRDLDDVLHGSIEKFGEMKENCLLLTWKKPLIDYAQNNGFSTLFAGVTAPRSLIQHGEEPSNLHKKVVAEFQMIQRNVAAFEPQPV